MRPVPDEFFIGYLPPLPPALARFVSRVVTALVVGAVLAGVAMAVGHRTLDGGVFEFGRARPLRGTVVTQPFPALKIEGDATIALLVAPGKHGADALVDGLEGRRVTLVGTRIQRGEHVAYEVKPRSLHVEARPDSPTVSSRPTDAAALAPMGSGEAVTLTGEVVDSKCFLGVMVPGEGKTHKDCASLCLRGGIPPALHVRDRQGASALVLLVGTTGEAIGPAAAPFAGEAVTVHGLLQRQHGWNVLRTRPDTWRRLTGHPGT